MSSRFTFSSLFLVTPTVALLCFRIELVDVEIARGSRDGMTEAEDIVESADVEVAVEMSALVDGVVVSVVAAVVVVVVVGGVVVEVCGVRVAVDDVGFSDNAVAALVSGVSGCGGVASGTVGREVKLSKDFCVEYKWAVSMRTDACNSGILGRRVTEILVNVEMA